MNTRSNTFSHTWTVHIAKFPEISHFCNLHDSFLGRHVNAASRKSLETAGYRKFKLTLSQNQEPFWGEILYEYYFLGALMIKKEKSYKDR